MERIKGLLIVLGLILTWYVWDWPVIYPLKIFVVLMHETGHALAAILTGGSVEEIGIAPDESGHALTTGGSDFIITSAGYLGSTFFGCLMLYFAGRHRVGKALVVTVAILTGTMTILYVRTPLAFLFGLSVCAVFLLLARYLPDSVSRWISIFVGLVSCYYSIFDIKSDIIDQPHLYSDARILADLTGIPTLVWGVLWFCISVWASLKVLRSSIR